MLKTKDIVLIALFAAIIIVLGLMPPIAIPLVPVPLTMQTLGVMLAGLMLGPWRGLLAVALYLLLAAAGLPVLAGGRGGLGVFVSPSGGFLLGMLVGSYVVGYVATRFAYAQKELLPAVAGYALAAFIGGILVVYLFGVPGMALTLGMTLKQALMAALMFLPGDIIKALVAAWVTFRVRRVYPL